jgi:hypothetical protein
LGAASFGFQSFSVVGDGNTTYYTIVDPATGAWEVGIGTYTASGTTLSRTTVLESSNAGSLVNFAAGTKDVFLTYPAERSVYLDEIGNLNIDANTSSSAVRITQTGTGNALLVEDSANPDATPTVITGDGNVVVGNTTSLSYASGLQPRIQTNSTGLAGIGISRWNAGVASNPLVFLKSRGATVGDFTSVVSGDFTGSVNFYGTDGTAGIISAQIAAQVDGTPGTNDMPGRLVFSTTADGAALTTERMRIDSAGNVGIGTSSPTNFGAGYTNTVVFGSTGGIFQARSGGNVDFRMQADSTAMLDVNSNHPMVFRTNATERMRIDSSGNVGIGTTSPTLPLNIGTSTLPAGVTIAGQMISSDVAAAAPLLSIRRSAASGNPIFAQFTSSGTAASPTAVALNRGLGRNDWWGFDGTNYINAAAISCAADGAVSTGVVPGRMVFSTSATNTPVERMRIDSAGNVGIGTSTPSSGLTVAAPIGTPSGNGVFLGTDGNYGAMQFNGSAGGFIDFSTSGTDFKGRIIYDNTTNFMSFYTNTAEAMRINTSGKVFMGTTTNPTANSDGILNLLAASGDGINIKHTVNGNNTINLWQTGTTTFTAVAFYKGNTQDQVGSIVSTTFDTNYNTSSDYRLKENIAPMTGALAKVAALKPCTYTWKANGAAGQGFIAHELQEVVPECVTGEKDAVDKDGKIRPQGIDTSFLVATLTAAIQEQQVLIQDLTARLTALEGQ